MRRAQDRARSARSWKNGARSATFKNSGARSATIEYYGARSATIESRALGALKLASEARDENVPAKRTDFSYCFWWSIIVYFVSSVESACESRLTLALKYVPHVIGTIFFVRCIPKVSRVGVVYHAKSWFSAHLKLYRTSALLNVSESWALCHVNFPVLIFSVCNGSTRCLAARKKKVLGNLHARVFDFQIRSKVT